MVYRAAWKDTDGKKDFLWPCTSVPCVQNPISGRKKVVSFTPEIFFTLEVAIFHGFTHSCDLE